MSETKKSDSTKQNKPAASKSAKIPMKKVKEGWGAGWALLFGFLAFIVPQILLGVIIGIYAETKGVEDTQTYFESITDSAWSNFWIVIVMGIGTLAIVYAATKPYGGMKRMLLEPPKKLKAYLLLFLAAGMYMAGTVALITTFAILFPDTNLDQEQDVGFDKDSTDLLALTLTFIALVIVTPIVEEILFRGFIFRGFLRDMNWVWAAIITSAIFGFAHLQLNIGLDTFAFGIALCWLYVKTKSLWPAIILHGIKNLIAFITLFIIGV